MALNALPPLSEKHSSVRAMFDRIAPRYDGMNRLMTAGLDQRWRRLAVDAIAPRPGERVLDLACGTGDLAELVAQRGARVVAADFSREMLRGARGRALPAALIQADGAHLPLRDASVRAAVCGFALRNFVKLSEIFEELARVVSPGGRIALLEVDRPQSGLLRAGHSFYFDRVIPFVGGLLSDREAYRYLPQSTVYLPPEAELLELIERAGFRGALRRPLLFGAVQLVTAQREATS
ncbi:MAG: ubiquinone/menaquinone biosynthesis methyltransferase [Myxococcales bacterium]|nr:ubiquinone/menaquinone biosynthesis methyltransferase [Myxococcales bacterium]